MRNNYIKTLMILMAMVLTFFLVPNTFGQDMGTASYSDGYGSYDRMGEDPAAVLLYGRHIKSWNRFINQEISCH